MSSRAKLAALLAAIAAGVGVAGVAAAGGSGGERGHEVWAVDQSNTNGTTSGGALYVYDGRELEGRRP